MNNLNEGLIEKIKNHLDNETLKRFKSDFRSENELDRFLSDYNFNKSQYQNICNFIPKEDILKKLKELYRQMSKEKIPSKKYARLVIGTTKCFSKEYQIFAEIDFNRHTIHIGNGFSSYMNLASLKEYYDICKDITKNLTNNSYYFNKSSIDKDRYMLHLYAKLFSVFYEPGIQVTYYPMPVNRLIEYVKEDLEWEKGFENIDINNVYVEIIPLDKYEHYSKSCGSLCGDYTKKKFVPIATLFDASFIFYDRSHDYVFHDDYLMYNKKYGYFFIETEIDDETNNPIEGLVYQYKNSNKQLIKKGK